MPRSVLLLLVVLLLAVARAVPVLAEEREVPPGRRAAAAAPTRDLEELAAHLKANPTDRAALKDYLLTAVNELKRRVNAKDADGAIELANTIEDIKSGLATVLYARGLAQTQKKQLDFALADFRAARASADQAGKPRPEIDISISNTCYAKSDWDGTLAALKDYHTHGGTIDPIWYLLNLDCLEKTQATDRLLEVLKEAVERFPQDPRLARWNEKYARTIKATEKESAMTQGGTLHFAIKFQDGAEDAQAKDRVERALEAAYEKVTRDLSHVPSKVVNVIIYTDRKEYEQNGEVPHWVGAHYDPQDASIRVGLIGSRMSEADFTGYLAHEFTHLILDEITQHNIPSWLTEGIAQIEQEKDMSGAEQKLRVALKRPDSLPSIGGLTDNITGSGAVDPVMGYAVAWSFTRYLQEQWGTSSMGTVLSKLGQKYSFEEAAASDYATLMKQWVAAEKSRLNVP